MIEFKTGRERLRPEQLNMFDNAIQISKHRIALFEAPTGFGKSIIVNTVAEAISLAHKDIKVIIATPTNQLALELLSIFKHDTRFTFDKSLSVDVVFGKENYFDLKNVTSDLFEYIDKEEFYAYVESIHTNEGYLIESLFNNIHIEEPYKRIVSEMIKCRLMHDGIQEFESLDIIITNYAFLLTNVFHVKDFDISNYVVIADEVHLLMETAENMLTNSFSLYRYRALTTALEKAFQKEDIVLSQDLLKKIKTQVEILNDISTQYSNANRAGDFYTVHPTQTDSVLGKIKESFLAKESKKKKGSEEEQQTTFFDSIEGIIKKELTKTQSQEVIRAYKMYASETRELRGVLNAVQEVNVLLSPSKGYPTLTSAKGDVRGWLLTYFWDKVYSFIGVSATINTSQDDKAAFSRFGINRSSFDAWKDKVESVWDFQARHGRFPTHEDKEFFRLSSFVENQKKGYEHGWLSEKKRAFLIEKFGIGFFAGLIQGDQNNTDDEKIEHIKFGVKSYNPVFSIDQARAFLPDCSLISPKQTDEEEFETWTHAMAFLIAQHYDHKNSMILCGSYKEAESIGEYLTSMIPKTTPLIVANRNVSAAYSIEQFKKSGGILVGIRNYGTGVNLPKKELEKLFITKLPFPIFTTKKWMDIKELDRKNGTQFYHRTYLNEMILTFRQWIGRLIRTDEDSGDLYILDSRICNKNYEKTLKYWIEKMATIQEERLLVQTHVFEEKSTITVDLFDLWLNQLQCSSDVKQYFTEHKEYIIAKDKLPIPINDTYSRDLKNQCREIRKSFRGLKNK